MWSLRLDIQFVCCGRKALFSILEVLVTEPNDVALLLKIHPILKSWSWFCSLSLLLLQLLHLLVAFGRPRRILLGVNSVRPLQCSQQHQITRHLALIRIQILILQLLLYVRIGLRLCISCRHQPAYLLVRRYLLLLLLRRRRVVLLFSAGICCLGWIVVCGQHWI